jgi:hypothetical protein
MTRADLIHEAIIDGLITRGLKEKARIIEGTEFKLDAYGRIVAQCPRPRLNRDRPAPMDMVVGLRNAIDDGLSVHGFGDAISIEP